MSDYVSQQKSRTLTANVIKKARVKLFELSQQDLLALFGILAGELPPVIIFCYFVYI